MLTPSDKIKLKQYDLLTDNHKSVFKHRLKKKCKSAVEDIEITLLYCQQLKIQPDDIIEIDKLHKLLETYEVQRRLHYL